MGNPLLKALQAGYEPRFPAYSDTLPKRAPATKPKEPVIGRVVDGSLALHHVVGTPDYLYDGRHDVPPAPPVARQLHTQLLFEALGLQQPPAQSQGGQS